ncbi:hypothetical protein EVG20_g11563 [Dentipellis fragilis]|uniref:Uncharacterized protein n=1 Tax=Dentipellis fragilis TaxID=205917 RepID=A0A4Y9XKY8_9AGAM|nr:hypothetical protein EVG20_g11563 [Dentipellis fragilis]
MADVRCRNIRDTASDPVPTLEGTYLLVVSKEDYVQMTIKEKELSGKAAIMRRDPILRRKGFNAFREMSGRGREIGRDGGCGPRRNAGAAPSGGNFDQVGEKRKLELEPDGGHDISIRCAAVPSIASEAKKTKTDGES